MCECLSLELVDPFVYSKSAARIKLLAFGAVVTGRLTHSLGV